MIQRTRFLFIAALVCTAFPLPAQEARPVLQILNGSKQTLDVFWLKNDAERMANGSIAPGKDTAITTTLGHRFALVGREDRTEFTVTSEVPVQGVRFDPPSKEGVPAFYTQAVSAGGFPIVASARVNPYALKEAAFLVNRMLEQRPDVRAALIKSGARMCLMAHDEFTTDLPEFVHLGGKKMTSMGGLDAKTFWDARARGTGGSQSDPYCTSAEENLLGYPGDPYSTECILIHEFAHCIHLRGMVNVDPTFDARLKETYERAMKAGLWKGKYASVNHHEYFAEGVQSWFDDNRVNDHDHNHVNTRALLLEYDPGLAAMCREVFGDTVLKYTKPATRLTGHLAGYDPAKAPAFVWPERLAKAKAEIRAKAQARSDEASASDPARTEIAPKVAAARAILDGWQAKAPERAERKLHIVYWTPADREPAPQYRERLSKILTDIQSFYSREMERVGFGPRTLRLDPAADGLVRIHLVRGKNPYAHYGRKSGDDIRGESISTLREAGLDPAKETVVIFCNMSNWDAEKRVISQNSPYYAGGSIKNGTAWQVDSPILNLDSLTDSAGHVQDGEYGRISLGRYNSTFIGGIAHEVGHALSLPHCRARPDESAAFGTSLMGAGNRTYGEDRRNDGRGTFLTLAEAFRLAGHPMFSGSVKGMGDRPTVKPADIRIEPRGKGFVFSGRALAEPPVYGVIAYMDPEGGGDYDAITATAVPDAEGRFSIDCQALKPGKAGELRITYLQANGVPSGNLSDTPFRYPYLVAKDGTADLGTARTKLLFAPMIEAVNAKSAEAARQLLAAPAVSGDARLKQIAQRLIATLDPKLIAPAAVPPATKIVPLSDLKATREGTGYGAPLRDRLPEPGGLLIAGGKLYVHGFYAHAVATHEWQIDGTWKTLTGVAGIADGSDGSVQAIIEGDGKVLWQSGTFKGGSTAAFDVKLEGVKQLVLKMTDAGDGKSSDWGVWLEPMLAR